ncbi:hypothetical protein TN91_23395 [Rhodococcus ruber]|nr:hypothetical protein TN91_23395 [Rhodococcus ruber]
MSTRRRKESAISRAAPLEAFEVSTEGRTRSRRSARVSTPDFDSGDANGSMLSTVFKLTSLLRTRKALDE